MSESSENTHKRTEKLWKPGQSGNPNGRPRGSLNKTTVAVQELLKGEAEKLTRKVIELALQGDTTSLKLCLERILPAVKETPVNFNIPTIENISELPMLTGAILESVASGELLPGEAERIGKIVENHRAALEIADLEARIRALESVQESK